MPEVFKDWVPMMFIIGTQFWNQLSMNCTGLLLLITQKKIEI